MKERGIEKTRNNDLYPIGLDLIASSIKYSISQREPEGVVRERCKNLGINYEVLRKRK